MLRVFDNRRSTSARLIVLMAIALPLVYILSVGIERFYFESLGTWLFSPVIYTKILPNPFNHILLRALTYHPILCNVLCAIPVIMIVWGIAHAVKASLAGSILHACGSFYLIAAVFIVYHYLQPMGFQYMAAS